MQMTNIVNRTLTLQPRSKGFTLIELMIVVFIIGLLVSIAYPSYLDSVRLSNRKNAMGAVQAAAQAMERFSMQNNTYVGAAAGTTFPDKSPIDGDAIYSIQITAQTATTYTITASPDAGSINEGDGNITLSETGARTWNGNNSWGNN